MLFSMTTSECVKTNKLKSSNNYKSIQICIDSLSVSLAFFFNLLSIRVEETVTNFEDEKAVVIIHYS
jgi:hypothetical protein